MKKYALLLLVFLGTIQFLKAQQDKYLWLEEVDGKRALEFVEAQNKATYDELSKEKDYQEIYDRSLEIANSEEKIAYPNIHGDYVYNFWKDKDHKRGIWRRCSMASYVAKNIDWEILLDVDKLSEKDNKKWVFKGAVGLYPSYDRFLVRLSNGGGDAVFTREFDVNKKSFIDDGFALKESKGSVAYVDKNTLVVGTNFGKGTMTTSGYPNQVKLWTRGTPLSDAKLIFEGDTTDVSTVGWVMRDGLKSYILIGRAMSFFSSDTYVWIDNKAVKLDIPNDAEINGILNNQLLVQLKSDWKPDSEVYKTGTLLSLTFDKLLKGEKDIQIVTEPDEFSSIRGVSITQNKVLVNMLSNVISELYIYSYDNGSWEREKVDAPDLGSISIVTTDKLTDKYFFTFENFLTPTTLYIADAQNNTMKPYQSMPSFFDASKYEVHQYKAKSKDGTMIPYFMVSAKDMKYDGKNPTLVNAYGGFEISRVPFYSATFGPAWIAKGGVYVLANIRGGGEFGPKWHQAAMKEKRQNAYDDLFAVSEDLISRKVTSPEHMGVMGRSNGGLLVGVAFTERPDLYNAAVCGVPLLDMKRYNKLLAGASWMGEYGNPDIPEEWAYIKKYSPYQNLKKGMHYPEVFFYTSTRDDRVHPGHARKMDAKMNDMGYKTYYYENTEGGHAGSSTNAQTAKWTALTFSYLWMKLR